MNKIFDVIYKEVKKIPLGYVTTYGQVAKTINSKQLIFNNRKISPQVVGWALHKNPDPQNIPCHRIVNKEGKLAKSFVFGGIKGQEAKLKKEGVTFKDNNTVNSYHILIYDMSTKIWRIKE